MLSVEVIKGVLRLVQTIRYSNGKTIKRIINPFTGMPSGDDAIIVVTSPSK